MKNIEIIDYKETRAGFGEGLVELAKKNKNVVALCADVTGSVKMDGFQKEFPERFVQCGIAEANMVGIAAGLSMGEKIPFVGAFAGFITGRVYDQIRQSVAYSNKNVKLCGSHAGITLGEDGATHQIMEDIGLMKMLPNMTVIVPCDANQTKQAVMAIAEHQGPVYLRYGRPKVPNFIQPNEKFEIGKAQLLQEGTDITLLATGHLVWEALEAAKVLLEKGVKAEVINIHTIKPLDKEAILKSVSKTGCVVTCEEHFFNGGLGDSVAQLLALEKPTPIEYVAVDDHFGESGKPEELMEHFGLKAINVFLAAEKVLSRK